MKYKVVVALECIYEVEANNVDEAEALATKMTPAEAFSVSIIETSVESIGE